MHHCPINLQLTLLCDPITVVDGSRHFGLIGASTTRACYITRDPNFPTIRFSSEIRSEYFAYRCAYGILYRYSHTGGVMTSACIPVAS